VLSPGVRPVVPLIRVVKMSVRTQEMKEVAEVPSREGLIMNLGMSVLYHLDASRAPDVYKTTGTNDPEVGVEPQFRSALREITASWEAKALYSVRPKRIAAEIFQLLHKLTGDRGIVTQQVLLRKIGLPPVVANAIQEELRREQEANEVGVQKW